MAIENSELNDSPPLKASNEGLKGGSGDGNRFTIVQLEHGFLPVEPSPMAVEPHELPILFGAL